MILPKPFDRGLRMNMSKAIRHLDGVDSLNPRRWKGKWLHHHGGGVCWLFVLLWIDLWHHELIVSKKWYKNNPKEGLCGVTFWPTLACTTPALRCFPWALSQHHQALHGFAFSLLRQASHCALFLSSSSQALQLCIALSSAPSALCHRVLHFKPGYQTLHLSFVPLRASWCSACLGGSKSNAVNLILRLYLYHFLHTMSLWRH